MSRAFWELSVFLSRWKNRIRYLAVAPRVYRNWWTMIGANWGSTPVVLELRNGLKYSVRPGTGDLGVINEAVILDPYLSPGHIRLTETSTVIDIGANIGDFSVQAARLCPRGTVYAVEPVEEHCRIIREQIALNGVTNVKVLACALGAKEGELELHVDGSKSSSNWGEGKATRVPMTTLEAVMKQHNIERIDVLKMDCEGAEWDIFPASEHLLPRVSQICMEYHNGKKTAAWLDRWLVERGYQVWRSPGPWCGLLWARRCATGGR